MIKKKSGFLITVEGIDGSGKSSIVDFLFAELSNIGCKVLKTKEPGGTKLGLHLRKLLQERDINFCDKSEYLLFAADRAQHISEVVEPAINSGSIVISDRMADSSLAYQGYGRDMDIDIINQINQWAMNFRMPDLTIYLKIDYQTSLKRLFDRNEDLTTFEKENRAFFERVSNGFDKILKRDNVLQIDANLSLDEVKEIVKDKVLKPIIDKLNKNFNEKTN